MIGERVFPIRTLLLSIGIAGCSTTQSGASPSLAGQGAAYESQVAADIDFIRFGQESKSCQLWTNWQKVCSRSGEKGRTLCRDSAVDVKPSHPFCVAYGDGKGLVRSAPDASEDQRVSYNRFCEEFVIGENSKSKCHIWNSYRPFDGSRIVEIEHPWCERWALNVDPSVDRDSSGEFGFYCADRNVEDWCLEAGGLGAGLQDGVSYPKPKDRIIIPLAMLDTRGVPVNFPFCKRSRNGAAG